MEIKLYLRTLINRWWLIVAAFFFTVIPAAILVNRQPWVYEASTSYVIRPREEFDVPQDEIVDAVGTLSRQPEISTTFAEVADSRLIKRRAIERLELSSQERRGLRVNGRVVPGTNVVEISVEGPNPAVVRDVADAAGLETATYVNALYDVFELEPLDSASFPNNPDGPNKLFTIVLGGGFGLLLGVGLVFLLEYLEEPLPEPTSFNIIDGDTAIYNESYLKLRLKEEVSRTRHGARPFSLALIKPGYPEQYPADEATTRLIDAMGPRLRNEDILAHLGSGTFALLLPGMEGEEAKELFEGLQLAVGRGKAAGGESIPVSSVGITSYRDGEATADEILTLAANAMNEAGKDPDKLIVGPAGSNSSPVTLLKNVTLGPTTPR